MSRSSTPICCVKFSRGFPSMCARSLDEKQFGASLSSNSGLCWCSWTEIQVLLSVSSQETSTFGGSHGTLLHLAELSPTYVATVTNLHKELALNASLHPLTGVPSWQGCIVSARELELLQQKTRPCSTPFRLMCGACTHQMPQRVRERWYTWCLHMSHRHGRLSELRFAGRFR